jgi:hypothetical protein
VNLRVELKGGQGLIPTLPSWLSIDCLKQSVIGGSGCTLITPPNSWLFSWVLWASIIAGDYGDEIDEATGICNVNKITNYFGCVIKHQSDVEIHIFFIFCNFTVMWFLFKGHVL